MNVLIMVINALLFSSSNNDNDNNTIIVKECFMQNSCYDSFEITVLKKSYGVHRLKDSRAENMRKNIP